MPFCAKCGNEVQTEDIYCNKCGSHLRDMELITENITIDYPETEDPSLIIRIPISGKVEINPGNEKLVKGTIRYDVAEWKPIITKTKNQVSIYQEKRDLLHHWGTPTNDWQLVLGKTKPYSLEIKTGVSRGNMDLGGLPLTGLNVQTGVGDSNVYFSEVNPFQMKLLKVQSGVGKTQLKNILNAKPQEVVVRGGIGHTTLDFNGPEPEINTIIIVDSGVGGFDINVRADTRVMLHVTGLTGVDTRGSIKTIKRSFGKGTYITEAYETKTGPILDFTVNIGVGGLTIRAN